MQLCKIGKASVGFDDVAHLALELFGIEMLGVLQAFGQQLANLLRRICLPQVVGGVSVNVVEHLVT